MQTVVALDPCRERGIGGWEEEAFLANSPAACRPKLRSRHPQTLFVAAIAAARTDPALVPGTAVTNTTNDKRKCRRTRHDMPNTNNT